MSLFTQLQSHILCFNPYVIVLFPCYRPPFVYLLSCYIIFELLLSFKVKSNFFSLIFVLCSVKSQLSLSESSLKLLFSLELTQSESPSVCNNFLWISSLISYFPFFKKLCLYSDFVYWPSHCHQEFIFKILKIIPERWVFPFEHSVNKSNNIFIFWNATSSTVKLNWIIYSTIRVQMLKYNVTTLSLGIIFSMIWAST